MRPFAPLVLAALVAACNAIDGADGYVKGDVDGGGDDSGACPTSCLGAARACLDGCEATHASCVSGNCNPGCQNNCDKALTSCNAGCASTCESCGACAASACENPPSSE